MSNCAKLFITGCMFLLSAGILFDLGIRATALACAVLTITCWSYAASEYENGGEP